MASENIRARMPSPKWSRRYPANTFVTMTSEFQSQMGSGMGLDRKPLMRLLMVVFS